MTYPYTIESSDIIDLCSYITGMRLTTLHDSMLNLYDYCLMDKTYRSKIPAYDLGKVDGYFNAVQQFSSYDEKPIINAIYLINKIILENDSPSLLYKKELFIELGAHICSGRSSNHKKMMTTFKLKYGK